MPKDFKYDVIELINSVKVRPCLWNKRSEAYKDRVERRMAWEEIFHILHDGYEDMTAEDKRITGEQIQGKWTNIRDTFVKTLKTKMGKPKRKYLLYEHLKFLTALNSDDDTVNEHSSELQMEFKTETPQRSLASPRKKIRKNFHDEEYVVPMHMEREQASDDVEFVEINESTDPRVMNEDEAFFASLLPTVVRYSDDEKLEFRLEVLMVMKKLKNKRRWSGCD